MLLLLQTIFCCVAATAVSGAVLMFFAWHGIPLSPSQLVGEPCGAQLITELGCPHVLLANHSYLVSWRCAICSLTLPAC